MVFYKLLAAIAAGSQGQVTAGPPRESTTDALETLYEHYRKALEGTAVTPKDLHSVVRHFRIMADLFRAYAATPSDAAPWLASTYEELAKLLQMLTDRLGGARR